MSKGRLLFWFNIMVLFVILATAEANQSNSSLSEPLLSLIPKDGELEGWVRDGTPALCYDEATLSEYIDGAAPYYLERGAVAVIFQYFLRQASDEEVKIEIYRMRNHASARLIFEEIKRGRPSSEERGTKGLGEGRHLEQALLGVYLLEFHEGPFFVRMEVQGKGLQTKEALVNFGFSVFHSIRALESKAR